MRNKTSGIDMPVYDDAYSKAYDQASEYFKHLRGFVESKDYISLLKCDFQSWEKEHVKRPFRMRFFTKKIKSSTDDNPFLYISRLEETGKLDQYLKRSISYIYMRDLGKDLKSPETQRRVESGSERLRNFLLEKSNSAKNNSQWFSPVNLYRFAQKEGIEETMIWLADKFQHVFARIPGGLDAVHAKRKLMKMIGGVVLFEMEEMEQEGDVPREERVKRMETAVRLGYYYGLTYPFIDDLFDSNVLSTEEKKQYSALIRTVLVTGEIPSRMEWHGKNAGMMKLICNELSEAFKYITKSLDNDSKKRFLEQGYVFYCAQEMDRIKDLENGKYTNEEIYVPVILKSASSRLIIPSVINAAGEKDFDRRMFYYGIYNQLSDDFTDMFADLESGSVTPYTYYLRYYKQRPDLINPFELYWAVIVFLIHEVYHSDPLTCEVILSRAINSLRRYKKRTGTKKYKDLMKIFVSKIPELNGVIQYMVKHADNVDFFDKLIRDRMIISLKEDEKKQEEFLNLINRARKKVNNVLPLSKSKEAHLLTGSIVDAANYVLESGGKRLRPVISLVMGNTGYGFEEESLVPLLKALEYMHTASLVFDDLPSQDNAPVRRGRPTLHTIYDVATAELTALFLTQKATEELASLKSFAPERVLKVIRYSAQVVMDMCRGQMADLKSVEKLLSLEELNRMSFYKTGLAFEASLLMPAILADADETEKQALRDFSYHAGIAFQIKDDLLDAEGDESLLGKPVGHDEKNLHATFVTVLGIDGAKKALWEHYCAAIDVLGDVPRNTSFLKQLMNYIVMRER